MLISTRSGVPLYIRLHIVSIVVEIPHTYKTMHKHLHTHTHTHTHMTCIPFVRNASHFHQCVRVLPSNFEINRIRSRKKLYYFSLFAFFLALQFDCRIENNSWVNVHLCTQHSRWQMGTTSQHV